MILAQGAEAIIFKNGELVVKERVSKKYRLSQLDYELRKFRTRREAKILKKLAEIDFPCTKLISVCDKTMKLELGFIEGSNLVDELNKNPTKFGRLIGELVGKLHILGIIHADLTTANMIVCKDKIYLIDFGLSFFSLKEEDMAVDLHLLCRNLNAKHSSVYETCWNAFVESYKHSFSKSDIVLKRLEKVELRGRNKNK